MDSSAVVVTRSAAPPGKAFAIIRKKNDNKINVCGMWLYVVLTYVISNQPVMILCDAECGHCNTKCSSYTL